MYEGKTYFSTVMTLLKSCFICKKLVVSDRVAHFAECSGVITWFNEFRLKHEANLCVFLSSLFFSQQTADAAAMQTLPVCFVIAPNVCVTMWKCLSWAECRSPAVSPISPTCRLSFQKHGELVDFQVLMLTTGLMSFTIPIHEYHRVEVEDYFLTCHFLFNIFLINSFISSMATLTWTSVPTCCI